MRRRAVKLWWISFFPTSLVWLPRAEKIRFQWDDAKWWWRWSTISLCSSTCSTLTREQELDSWRNFNSSEDPTRESFLSETNFLVSKLRRNTSLPCLSYYPNPSVIPSITQLKTWRLEPSRWQVHKCLFQNKATLTYGGREGSLLAASSTIPGRGSTIHVTIAKSLGGSKTKNR